MGTLLLRAGGQGAEGFCKRVNQGQALVVTVKNVGNARAPESTTEIEFSPGGSFQLPTPALSPAAVFDQPPIDFPVGCFNPDCHFKITVDSKGEVSESDERNNAADGTCIG